MHRFIAALLAAFLASTATADDAWSARLAALPAPPPPMTGDWLVAPPARTAGVFRADARTLVLDNGLVRRSFRLAPNLACFALEQLTTGESLLRAVRPECELTIDGMKIAVGGLVGQPIQNFLRPEWLDAMAADPQSFVFEDFESGPIEPRFAWRPRTAWLSRPAVWPPPGVHLVLRFRAPAAAATAEGLRVAVHYELYDGLPLMCKWFALENAGSREVRLDGFASEVLAFVEAESEVEQDVRPELPNVHVETDCTLVAMTGESGQRKSARWLPDPTYTTQVNYRLETPCLLECRPPLGPSVAIPPGGTFESLRTWLLVFDSTDAVRRTLSLCRMYRTIAPWAMENPLIFHARSAEPAAVRAAIDQAADVGFELVILTFGSGFDAENASPEYKASMRQLAEYAHAKDVALGGYSLLASRSLGPEHDVINPATSKPGGFAVFENSPCLGSAWGRAYFKKLYDFYEATGFYVLEHDGSYPGDACASTAHPGHAGYADSYWRQRETIVVFYRWCRGRGVYLNVPDWYFLNGSSKTGMGYRETNWSLPRDQQEIIERQNIFDGTRFKTPSMGWMFVPLTEYHGGGPAATIEPLHEHRDHYERRLANLLGAGVQACFRGPRLYDTADTRAIVAKWVAFYKQHRAILDGDLVPLRRADGRDWDGWLHVNPGAAECGLAMIYNPLDREIDRTIRLPLYYTGLTEAAHVRAQDQPPRIVPLARDYSIQLDVHVPAQGRAAVIIEPPK
ncbi:MAG: hypothetical protein HZB38_09090 [Planctomycetes bacterium]|nr:hypothetical protein [Planctomycetota bacterium]